MKNVTNKTVFITGGSSGIGLETAKRLAEKGANIAIFARKKEQLETSLEQIKSCAMNGNQSFNYMTMDVSDVNDISETLTQAITDFGVPDLLINSAGVSYAGEFESISPEKFNSVMQINVNGTRNVTAAVVPHMKKNGGGSVVIVASSAGLLPVYGYTAYGTSKYALVGFAECLRSELKPENITVQVLCPPEINTPMLEEENKISPIETKYLKVLAGTLSVEHAATALINGIMKKRFMIIPGFLANLFFYMKRYLPGFMFRSTSDMIITLARLRKRMGNSAR